MLMNTKLTLKLDSEVIARAKYYAKRRRTSLSKMVESYLDAISREEDPSITPLVEQLSGVIELPEDFDYKMEKADHLNKKHT